MGIRQAAQAGKEIMEAVSHQTQPAGEQDSTEAPRNHFWGLPKPYRILTAEIIGAQQLFALEAAGIIVYPRQAMNHLKDRYRVALAKLSQVEAKGLEDASLGSGRLLDATSVDPLDPATWRGQVDAGDLAQGQGRLGLAVLRGLEAAHGW